MLNKLITLVIVLVIAYLAMTQALPWIQRRMGATAGDEPQGGGEAAECLFRTTDANESLSQAIRRFAQPPIDQEEWSTVVWEIEREIQSAAAACICPLEACLAASRALDEIRALLSNLDGMARGDSTGFSNPARQQERIFELLDEARAAAG